MKYSLYTDGACQPNPGQGGWAYLLVDPSKKEQTGAGSENDTTNNRMELMAVLRGMQHFSAHKADGDELEICSDSSYLINGIRSWSKSWKRNGWKKSDGSPIVNLDLWKQIREVADTLKLSFLQVKGHSGHIYNERVDKLAVSMVNSE